MIIFFLYFNFIKKIKRKFWILCIKLDVRKCIVFIKVLVIVSEFVIKKEIMIYFVNSI